jgi:hypothetical protein
MDYIKYFIPWMVHAYHIRKLRKLALKSKLKLKVQSLPQFIRDEKLLAALMNDFDLIIKDKYSTKDRTCK